MSGIHRRQLRANVQIRRFWFLSFVLFAACQPQERIDFSGPVAGWDYATGGIGGGQFSPLTQINKRNVRRLEVAWTYRSPDFVTAESAHENLSNTQHVAASVATTPIIADGKLVMCTPFHQVVAIDPDTGTELWTYDPKMNRSLPSLFCRGVASWSETDPKPLEACQQRIFSSSGDGRLLALDVETGLPCQDFGTDGVVNMLDNLGSVRPGEYYQTAPPLVVGDLVLAGSAVRDVFRTTAPSGVVRAWDSRSGTLVWAQDLAPPSVTPVTAEGSAAGAIFTPGTPNVWSYLSADIERGLVYLPTGNAAVDHFKGPEREIDRYGSSIVALDAATGRIVWHFQAVHHDVFDYDIGAQPVLYEHRGKIPAIAVSTKAGHIFLLNRVTGEPLFPVEERPVPQTDVPGEWTFPTQPFPTMPKPVLNELITESDLIDWPVVSKGCREQYAELRYEGLYTPPSIEGTLQSPGVSGGFNWGAGSINPSDNQFVTTYLNMPYIIRLEPREDVGPRDGDESAFVWSNGPQYGTRYRVRRQAFLSDKMVPCIKPPWGSIMAIDLNTGRQLWRKPLGSLYGRLPLVGAWFNVGAPVSGGNLQTASGLVFAAASADEHLRAFDAKTGDLLWAKKLPFSAHATPMTYRLGRGGKQFLVVASGGMTMMDKRTGNTLVAFTLAD